MQQLRSNRDKFGAYTIVKEKFGAAYETSHGICDIFCCGRNGGRDVFAEHFYGSVGYSDMFAPRLQLVLLLIKRVRVLPRSFYCVQRIKKTR